MWYRIKTKVQAEKNVTYTNSKYKSLIFNYPVDYAEFLINLSDDDAKDISARKLNDDLDIFCVTNYESEVVEPAGYGEYDCYWYEGFTDEEEDEWNGLETDDILTYVEKGQDLAEGFELADVEWEIQGGFTLDKE
jgi:uncharacterized protein YodC (DUF2158 family)